MTGVKNLSRKSGNNLTRSIVESSTKLSVTDSCYYVTEVELGQYFVEVRVNDTI
jgi:hypothetical protein